MFTAHGNQPGAYRTLFEKYPLRESPEAQNIAQSK
jgi:hypothetical protein